MKKHLLVIFLFPCFLSIMQGQNMNQLSTTDSIIVQEGFFGFRYYQGSERLRSSEVKDILRGNNNDAYKLWNQAMLHNGLSNVAAIVGGGMVGYGLTVGDDNSNGGTIAVIGLGLVVGSLILASSYTKKIYRSVDMYNSGLRQSAYFRSEPEIHFGFTSNGMGLIWRF
ncbi:MAG: hypothetical protein JJU02_15395 [Cryomorphaceae bacterium]|nr:hypothetical protein [Cryomorphaceae bacterium]